MKEKYHSKSSLKFIVALRIFLILINDFFKLYMLTNCFYWKLRFIIGKSNYLV